MFFPYEFEPAARPMLRLLGVRPDRDGVRLDDERLAASFGWLSAVVERDNIKSVSVTGPYRWFKVLGPRLSMADHGLTFGTNADHGVCIEFHDPLPAVFGPWNHPGITLTVAEPEKLVEALDLRA